MHSDPAAYIIFAALLGACIGFFGCSLFASRAINRRQIDSYRRGKAHGIAAARKPRI
jgi:hypothetical protein